MVGPGSHKNACVFVKILVSAERILAERVLERKWRAGVVREHRSMSYALDFKWFHSAHLL